MNSCIFEDDQKHKPQLRETWVRDRQESTAFDARTLIISGCGSTGVTKEALDHDVSNHFAIIKVLPPHREPGTDFLKVEWREMAVRTGADWNTSDRWTIKG